MPDPTTERWARALLEARRLRQPIEPLTDEMPQMTADDAYAVQQRLVELLLEGSSGERIAGYKLGLTSKAMQEMLGVQSPDYGAVLSSTVLGSGADVALDSFIAPRVEAEIVLLLRAPLRGPGVTPHAVRAATLGAVASLEIVDSRVRDWRIQLPDTIADLASAGAAAVSSRLVPIEDLDLRLLGMLVTRNGRLVDTGAGAATLGDPLAAVAWLANALAALGIGLEAGHLVMTGALHRAFPMERGDVIRAEFDRLGPVSVRVV